MTLLVLKIIALVSMTVDHIGRFFFPESVWMTTVGRIAFPIFAWGVANGYRESKDISKYGIRLGAVGIISQIPYALAFIQIGRSPYELNILFTLLLGLCAIIAYDRIQEKYIRNIVLVILICLGTVCNVSYGWYGVTIVLLFHTTFQNIPKRVLLFTIATIGYVFFYSFFATIKNNREIVYRGLQQLCSLAALIPISLYHGISGRRLKYVFYIYYPLHLSIIAVLYYLIK